jgi:hypothetical protein
VAGPAVKSTRLSLLCLSHPYPRALYASPSVRAGFRITAMRASPLVDVRMVTPANGLAAPAVAEVAFRARFLAGEG